jgi:hypothetical protein
VNYLDLHLLHEREQVNVKWVRKRKLAGQVHN